MKAAQLLAVVALLALASSSETPPPSDAPVAAPTVAPTATPTRAPTAAPTATPTNTPSAAPTAAPSTATPTVAPTATPTAAPSTATPTASPTAAPTRAPTTATPTATPTTATPTAAPTTATPTVAPTSLPEGSGLGNGYPQAITVAAPDSNGESSGANISLVVADGSGIPATVTVSSAPGNATVGFEFSMRAFSKRGYQAYAVREKAVIPEGLQLFMSFEANASAQPTGPLRMKITYTPGSVRWNSRRRSLYLLNETTGTWASTASVCAGRSMTTVNESDTREYLVAPLCHFTTYAVFEETNGRTCAKLADGTQLYGCDCKETSERRTGSFTIILWVSAGLALLALVFRLIRFWIAAEWRGTHTKMDNPNSCARSPPTLSFFSNILFGVALITFGANADTTHLISGSVASNQANHMLWGFGGAIILVELFGTVTWLGNWWLGRVKVWTIRSIEAAVFFLAALLLADAQDVQVQKAPNLALWSTVVLSSIHFVSAVANLVVVWGFGDEEPNPVQSKWHNWISLAYYASRTLALHVLALIGTWQPCSLEIPASVNALNI